MRSLPPSSACPSRSRLDRHSNLVLLNCYYSIGDWNRWWPRPTSGLQPKPAASKRNSLKGRPIMIDRRKFLAILGATVAAADAGFRPAFAAPPEGASGSMPAGMTERAYTFFTDPEIAFVKAAVARL